ncbi:MAG: hypothetical protein JJ891_01175 [Rhizobiaceae bacterium]|nr:hypothetical protein [Rhizobiaceae bacterium]
MQAVNPFTSSALAVFKKTANLQAQDQSSIQNQPVQGSLVPGIKNPATTNSAAEARIADNFFSMSYRDTNEIKMQIFERLGEKLGLEMKSYEDPGSFARDLRLAVQEIRRKEGGESLLKEIGHELGLDKLGVTIDDVINAIDEPDGEADNRLTKAIEEEYKINLKKDGEPASPSDRGFQIDDIGLYSIHP